MRKNSLGQPIGAPLNLEFPRPLPPRAAMHGSYCSVVPLDIEAHTAPLYAALSEDADGASWTYLPHERAKSSEGYKRWLQENATSGDPMFHIVLDRTGSPLGHATYLRIAPMSGTIEVGFIHFAPRLQRTPAATEAMYLMMARVFDALGYRRYEWKCDALNGPSRRAAERLGFQFEGIFRQATHYKGRNRDTAWFAVIDKDWPRLKAAFENWLAPENFDEAGQQIRRLEEFR